ncbi:MAG: acyltransferase family protein [Clostridia bacterium]
MIAAANCCKWKRSLLKMTSQEIVSSSQNEYPQVTLNAASAAGENTLVPGSDPQALTDNIAFLRVFAAISVFAVHMYCAAGQPQNSWGSIAAYGAQGQIFFYILSGLLVMDSYARSKSSKQYCIRRIARIAPLYYSWLIVILGCVALGWLDFGAARGAFDIPRALLMLGSLMPPTTSYAWNSMAGLGIVANFVVFYALVPIISKYIKNVTSAFFLVWGMILMALLTPSIATLLYSGICGQNDLTGFIGLTFCSNAYFIAFGVLIYYGVKTNKKQLFAYLLLFYAATNYFSFLKPFECGAIFALFAAIIICFPLKLGWIGKVFQKLSPYTFTFFIVHMTCWPVMVYLHDQYHWKIHVAILIIASSVMVSFFVYHLIERPARAWILKKFQA